MQPSCWQTLLPFPHANSLVLARPQDKVKGQLLAAGIFQAIEIRKKGYSQQLPKADFVKRYLTVLSFQDQQAFDNDEPNVGEFLTRVCELAKKQSKGKVGARDAVEGTNRVLYRFALEDELDKVLKAQMKAYVLLTKCRQMKKKAREEADDRKRQRNELFGEISKGDATSLDARRDAWFLNSLTVEMNKCRQEKSKPTE